MTPLQHEPARARRRRDGDERRGRDMQRPVRVTRFSRRRRRDGDERRGHDGGRWRAISAQSGQETLQVVLAVAFVLLPVLVAILTLASAVHVYIASQAAAAAGARAAGTAGGFGPDEQLRVLDELAANGVDPATCTIAAQPATVGLDQPIAVTVSCPRTIGIPFLLQGSVDLRSTFVARGEVNR